MRRRLQPLNNESITCNSPLWQNGGAVVSDSVYFYFPAPLEMESISLF